MLRQGGAARRYHHEYTRWPQAVTGITDEAGVRYGSYAYDAQGRVTRSELVGGAERLDFAYASDAAGKPTTTVTDYTGIGGAATTRSYTFTDIGNVRYPANLTAPCSLCGSTQQSSTYNAAGQPIKQIAHDGSVTFTSYDAKGRETERATFPASFASATTRPALASAGKVVSTKWHTTFNLSTQLAEPNKTTANTYNSKGMLTGQSWTATTDATGAAKFTAVKTGSTYATGWSYSASSLATSVVQKEGAAIQRRWTVVNDARGQATKATDEAGNISTASFDAHGNPIEIRRAGGQTVKFTLSSTMRLLRSEFSGPAGSSTAQRTYNPVGLVTQVANMDGSTLTLTYDQSHKLIAIDQAGTCVPAARTAQSVQAAQASIALADTTIPGRPYFPGPFDIFIPGSPANQQFVDGVWTILKAVKDACQAGCGPCVTISGRVVLRGDLAYDGPHTTHSHGGLQPHVHIFKANQAPRNSPKPCKCFWDRNWDVVPTVPPGMLPVEPFVDDPI